MDQRRTAEWKRGDHGRIKVLIEDPAVAWFGDFGRYRSAGFEVAVCTGPVGDQVDACPYLVEGQCELWDAADVVVCGLPLEQAACRHILAEGRKGHPDTPVVVSCPTDLDALEEASLAHPQDTVDGRIAAIRRAMGGS
ncbi:MAG TPA: hypothetical protein VE990_10955 [Acidimicrobiales bacterium]|nr:hypothetical protein [Acidimicrobiales bacterium]